jgi:cytochrome c6
VAVRRVAGLLLAGIAALGLSACGTGGKATKAGDQAAGQTLFTSKCAGCHTLAAAGAQGTIGPNLDDAFAADRVQGFKQSSIQNIVLDQIRQASAPMPKNLVTGTDAQSVAAYVAAVAGQGGTTAQPAQLGNDGKKIFTAKCGSCHTLKAAGTTGTVGPNLDQLKPSKQVAEHQVTVGGGVMPAFKGTLTQKQIEAVASFVASSVAK